MTCIYRTQKKNKCVIHLANLNRSQLYLKIITITCKHVCGLAAKRNAELGLRHIMQQSIQNFLTWQT